MVEKALLNIDYTVDFVADNGALTCGKPGQDIEDAIVQVTKDFISNGDFVVFAIDTHQENDNYHPESKLFPPHNIEGTKGRDLFGRLKDVYENNKTNAQVYWMNKTRYSAFAGTDLELKLRERQITEVHLIGVCTDICVLHTAVDAFNKGYKVVVYKDAVASFNQLGHEWALSHFQNSIGAEIR